MVLIVLGIAFIFSASFILFFVSQFFGEFAIMPLFVSVLVLILGILLFLKGFIQFIKNFLTSKYGEDGYGVVESLVPSGVRVNDSNEYEANVAIYLPSCGETVHAREVVGFPPVRYPVGSFVFVKYYKGDVNIIGFVSNHDELSEEVKDWYQFYSK